MAQKVNIVLVDDLDGSAADETVTFGLDGTSYEIDLNDKNAAQLRDAMAGYVAVARRVGRPGSGRRSGRRGSGSSANSGGANLREVRDWARSNGYQVSDRGRVSADIMDAFNSSR